MSNTSNSIRWLKISLRTLHLIGICGVVGGVLFAQPWPALAPFWVLTVVSGLVMILVEVLNNWLWLIQVRGVVIIVKLLLLLLLGDHLLSNQMIMITVICLSGIIAHAPGNLRYYSVLHGRRVDSIRDTKG